MIILHIGWHDNKLSVWGEQEAALPSQTKNKGVSEEQVTRSPYDVSGSALCRILKTLLWESASAELPVVSLQVELPTVQTPKGPFPLASLAFLDCGEIGSVADASPVLRLWGITALSLSWKQVFMLLSLCHEKRLAEGLFAGEDLLVCADLFRYAGALTARGRFLPALRKTEPDTYEAWWKPSIDGAERLRVAALAARLPRLVTGREKPIRVAETILNELTDWLVRFSVVTTLSRAQAEHGKFYSVHDAWFSALRGEGRIVRWESAEEIEELRQTVRFWRRPVESTAALAYILRFDLDAPVTPDEPWILHVRFMDGEQTYAFPTQLGTQRNVPQIKESLLRSLGQAESLFLPLARADTHDWGFGCLLTTDEAYVFLTTAADLLKASGYRVCLPEEWNQDKAHAVALEAHAVPHEESAAESHSLDEKVDITWTVTLNGERITPDELSALLHAQSPLVYFRGQWIHVNVRKLQDALRVWQRKTADTQSALQVVRLALGSESHCGLDVSSVQGSGWLDPFLKQLGGEQTFEVLSPPSQFCGELRPYQTRGYSWLTFLRNWGFGACLADDMGLGKTVQALAFLQREKECGEKRPALLVGPMSVLGNWLREAQRFTPTLRCMLHHGPQRWHGDSFAQEAQSVDLVITSYHLLYRDYTDLRKVPWSGILLDEAQNIKNPDTHQAQAARALQGSYRIALTGTPMENHVGDLWSVMDFLNPGMLGKRTTFREKFFRPIQSGTDPGARSRLRQVTMPFILRRLKTDRQIIADLPEKIESKVYCPLTREQVSLYEEVLETFQREVELSEGIARRGLILAVLTRLKQVCNHPANYLGQSQALAKRSGKLLRLQEMLEETFSRGESALVFTQYAEMGSLLKRSICQTFASEMPFLHGGVPRKERDRMVQEFQESERPQAFILSLKAGGTGLNLTKASHVFHYDRWWNPAVEDQATDRAFRIGQTKNVMVHKFICNGTLEDRIDALIEHKTALASEIVASGESFLTELSNEELRELLSLDQTQKLWSEEGA